MQRLFLHVGRHKCGTSSIQHFLWKNRDWLKEQGFIYPTTGIKAVAHHHLALLLKSPTVSEEQFAKVASEFRAEVRGYDNVILSSEALQNVTDSTHLARFLEDFEVVIICYFREILDYLQSSYAQRIQNSGDVMSFGVYSEKITPRYAAMVGRFKGIASRVVVRVFERDRLREGDVVKDFLHALGLKAPGQLGMRRNPSIGGNLLYFKLLVNLLGLHERSHYLTLEEMSRLDARYASGFRIGEDLAAGIRARLRQDNEWLERQFGPLRFRSFADRPGFPDQERLAEDLGLFLQRQEFAAVHGLLASSVAQAEPPLAKVRSL